MESAPVVPPELLPDELPFPELPLEELLPLELLLELPLLLELELEPLLELELELLLELELELPPELEAAVAPTVNDPLENAACCVLRRAIWPACAPLGTVTCATVSLITRSPALCAEPIQAVFDPVKPEPFTVTTVPTGPETGENPLMLCCG